MHYVYFWWNWPNFNLTFWQLFTIESKFLINFIVTAEQLVVGLRLLLDLKKTRIKAFY